MHNITHLKLVFDELRTTPQDALRRNHELIQTDQSISLKPFMQNKPNFQISKSGLTLVMTNSYNNFSPLGRQKSKPNSNPNKPNSKILKSALTLAMTNHYNKKRPILCQKNKPNPNPISKSALTVAMKRGYNKFRPILCYEKQTQTNPIYPIETVRRQSRVLLSVRSPEDYFLPSTLYCSASGQCQVFRQFVRFFGQFFAKMGLCGHLSGILVFRHIICTSTEEDGLFGVDFTVAASNKKVIVLLAAVLVSVGALMVCGGEPPAAETDKPLLSVSSPGNEDSGRLFRLDTDLALSSDSGMGTGELFFKMMGSVLLIVVLGAAAIYVSKKYLPGISNLPGKEIHIIETAALGPRKRVHLLKIGCQKLLIGSTNENITMLADITDAPDA